MQETNQKKNTAQLPGTYHQRVPREIQVNGNHQGNQNLLEKLQSLQKVKRKNQRSHEIIEEIPEKTREEDRLKNQEKQTNQ